MPALALDIGTYSLKAVVGKPGAQVEVIRVAEAYNTTGVSVPTDDVQVDKLAEIINTFITDHNLPIDDLRLSLPENVVSNKVIAIPRLTDAELASAINWQAEQYIPIPLEELALEYQVLYRPDANQSEKMRVLLIGVRKPVIERYMSIFAKLGIEPALMETQMISLLRAIHFTAADATSLVVHLGANLMNLTVIHQGELAFVFNYLSGSQLLTKTVEQTFNLNPTQAEQYKRTYGLDVTQFSGKVAEALKPSVKLLTDEMLKATRFFVNANPTATVQRVLLSGGGVQLPGLVEHITSTLGMETLLVAPFASARGTLPETNQAALSVGMGLLMRDL